MGKYGQAAIEAVKLILSIKINPIQAWEIETKKLFSSESVRNDLSPKNWSKLKVSIWADKIEKGGKDYAKKTLHTGTDHKFT